MWKLLPVTKGAKGKARQLIKGSGALFEVKIKIKIKVKVKVKAKAKIKFKSRVGNRATENSMYGKGILHYRARP